VLGVHAVTPSPDSAELAWVDGAMLAQLEVAAFSQAGYSLMDAEMFEQTRAAWQHELDFARNALPLLREPAHLWLLVASLRRGSNTAPHLELAGAALTRFNAPAQMINAAPDCAGPLVVAPSIHVSKLLVLPRFSGRGGGAALLAAIEANARGEGACELTLSVERTNARARRLYERAGYVRVAWPEAWPVLGFASPKLCEPCKGANARELRTSHRAYQRALKQS
jgi:GNAT superfamily N-acetyltransferase